MDIQEKQARWALEKPLFEAEFIHSHLLPFFNFNENTGDYEINSDCVANAEDEDQKVAYETLNTGWVMWLRAKRNAKAQSVPAEFEIGQLKDRIAELLDERQDLYAQLDAEAVPKWVSVENTTPNKNGDYIVCIDGEPCSAFFKWVNDHWKEFKVGAGITEGIHGWWHTHLNVTHWMPLPDAPQEQSND